MASFLKRLIDYFQFRQDNQQKQGLRNDNTKYIRPLLNKLMSFILVITLIIFVALALFFCTNKTFVIFSIALVIGAYFISGCVLGFIFGIPKKYQNKQAAVQVDKDGKPIPFADPSYTDNTSLEEISDWITKIVIGLSLVQFNRIKGMIAEAANNISNSLKSGYTCNDGKGQIDFFIFGYAIIIFYSIAGAMIGYLWTRVEFPSILAQKDRDLREAEQKKNQVIDDTIKSMNANLVEKINEAQDRSLGNDPNKPNFEVVTDSRIDIINQIIANTSPGPDKDDPQKNRWGGKSSLNNFKLSAEVTTSDIPSLYKLRIIVSTLDQAPLETLVAILLHDTFKPSLIVIDPKGNKEVFVEVIAYEAFTVAALCNIKSLQEYTRLELDLNQLPGLPSEFYWG